MLEKLEIVAAIFFGLIHGYVSRLDEGFRVQAVVGKDADAYAGANFEAMMTDEIGSFQHGEQLLRAESGVFCVGDFGKKYHEFVATLAADGIGVADTIHQAFSDGLQECVSDGMAQRIVNVFEMIQIQKEHGELAGVAVRYSDGLRDAIIQIGAIG